MSKIKVNQIQNHLDEQVQIFGFIKKIRNLGKLCFLDIFDDSGLCQVITDSNDNLSLQSFVEVVGTVSKRSNINSKIINGDLELANSTIKVLSKASELPFDINNIENLSEDLKIKYRYLYVRNSFVLGNLKLRSNLYKEIDVFLHQLDFYKIDTPILTKPTPEGAKEFLVLASKKNHYYSLCQSPQIFKQLLINSGVPKYYQIAKCFRNEDLRSDRQPEFTQLDIELLNPTAKDVMTLIEGLLKHIMKTLVNENVSLPFKKISFHDAMTLYGCDKPDLRFEYPIKDISNFFQNSEFKIFQNIVDQGGHICAIGIDQVMSNSQIKQIEEEIYKMDKAKISFIKIVDGKQSSPILKFLTNEMIKELCNIFAIKNNGIIFISSGYEYEANIISGRVRTILGKEFNLYTEKYSFCWVVDWPMFGYDKDVKSYFALHHPFTNFNTDDDLTKLSHTEILKLRSTGYDIVLNGYEIGGGSLRIYDYIKQTNLLKFLGMTSDEIENNFSFLINSFKYGCPPHGGIALGIDRICMILTNTNQIKDVIAFPKNNQGEDLLIGSPIELNKHE